MTNQEIDRLVAEKIMNWIQPVGIFDTDGNQMFRSREPFDHLCRGECYWKNHSLAGTESAPFRKRGNSLPPNYSSDIAQAWEVNLKIRQTSMSTEEGYQIVAKYMHYLKPSNFMYLSSQDAAREICLAALKAKGLIDDSDI